MQGFSLGSFKLTPPPARDPNIPVTPDASPRPATAVEALFIKPLNPEPEPALPP
jgi:hypothetical protein